MNDVWCVCDRCKTASRVETGNEIPRHWQHRFTPQIGWRDLCPGCVRGIAISEPEFVPVVHGDGGLRKRRPPRRMPVAREWPRDDATPGAVASTTGSGDAMQDLTLAPARRASSRREWSE